jgi:DSF synthase
MTARFRYPLCASDQFPDWRFQNLDFSYHEPSRSVWMAYKADGPPFYTLETLGEIACVRDSLRALFDSPSRDRFPVRYFVMASRKKGVFNLGGDLAMFAASVREQNRDRLRTYAHACIELVHGLTVAFDLPMITVSVVTGQALGGGLEAALAEDFLIAEETARMGVPEVAFNTFPGMGAITLLSRRLGAAAAEQIIASGRTYTGQEMYDLGVVDVVTPDGNAHESALEWMLQGGTVRPSAGHRVGPADLFSGVVRGTRTDHRLMGRVLLRCYAA